MSNLTGHFKLTKQAVTELAVEQPRHPIYSVLAAASLQENAIARDMIDVVILGHWADFGQCHHFMRRFDRQSEREAYEEAIRWIATNALDAARTLAKGIDAFYSGGSLPASSSRWDSRSTYILSRASWQSFGNAIHCTQDSFARGHAEREESTGFTPGPIWRIKRYAGAEKAHHEDYDKLWRNGGGFSQPGRFAINATKSLIRVVVETAATAKTGNPSSLTGFDSFKMFHLAASPKLSKERDEVFDLIDRYYTGARVGATNVKTLNMDEKGLASALIGVGMNSALVLKVFERLDDHYNSDADDVAELYVNEIRKHRGALENALRGNGALINRLIKVMDEGWTSASEKACIAYLRGLR